MAAWTKIDLKRQFDRAVSEGWLPYFSEAALECNHRPSVLWGIGSRETNLRNILGDYREGRYHGYGVMQVDVGTDPDWIQSGAWKDARLSIRRGAEILSGKRSQIERLVEASFSVRDRKGNVFKTKGKPFLAGDLLPISLAAYNSGLWAYYHYSKGRSPDYGTTGQDYSADVLRRAKVFARLLETV